MDGTDSDTDFQAHGGESDGEESAEEVADDISVQGPEKKSRNRSTIIESNSYSQGPSMQENSRQFSTTEQVPAVRSFKRVKMNIPQIPYPEGVLDSHAPPIGGMPQHAGSEEHREEYRFATNTPCLACSVRHPPGSCPLKLAGVEFCGLCGLAHYGSGLPKSCPHLNSVTQCRIMLETLKSSPEPKEHIETAKKYIVGVIARLKLKKKQKRSEASRSLGALQPSEPSIRNQHNGPDENLSKESYASPYINDVHMMNDNSRLPD